MDSEDIMEQLTDIWDNIKNRGYSITALLILILLPVILGMPGFDKMPIIGDIYALGRQNGLFAKNTFFIKIVSLCLIWAIFAASWDFLSGYTGQISFGHAIFFGISAYFTYWLISPVNSLRIPFLEVTLYQLKIPILDDVILFFADFVNGFINFFIEILGGNKIVFDHKIFRAFILSCFISLLLAVGIGIVALRVKGPYLALITLLLPLIASHLVLIFRDYTQGNYGISFGLDQSLQILVKTTPINRELDALNFYFFVLFVFLLAIGTMMLVAFSRIGLTFQAIREDEDAAESLGINVKVYKIIAFAVSAFFAGLAGNLWAQWLSFTGPSFFDTSWSFGVIIMCVIGGVGSIIGGVIGAFLLIIIVNLFLTDVFADIGGLDILAYGALLIITLRYMPHGLTRATKDQKRACMIGILFALFWAILPSSTFGWGIDLFSSILPKIPETIPKGDFFGTITALLVTTTLSFVGKFDYLGQMASTLTPDNILIFLVMLIMFIVAIPAFFVFLICEIFGLFILETGFGLLLSTSATVKAKFLIYVIIGIPFAFYLPKIYKKARIRYWGIWPSAGRYEPD